MIKEAIEKIAELAKPDVCNIDGNTYVIDKDGKYEQIMEAPVYPERKTLSSLEAVVSMVETEALKDIAPIYIEIPSPTCVAVFTQPMHALRDKRISLYEAHAVDVPGWEAQTKLPFDQAAVALQTRFQDGGDRDYTLQLLSQISTGAKVTYNDIGVATTVVTSKGVSLQQNSTIRPVVRLRPYRTFQEVEQPEGLFLIRIDERGIAFTEADGGMWKLTARRTIKAYFAELLAEPIADGRVIVML